MKRLQPRGQAVLELSLLMLILVPIIFYTLFLDDLLRHRLDLLEAVVSSAWDYTAIDQQDSKGADISRGERLSWCDHTPVYNSYDRSFECENPAHHKEFTAHICWVIGDGEQIKCVTDKSAGKIDHRADYNGGGITTCSAKAGVLNYFIINKFAQQFSNVGLTTKVYNTAAGDEQIDVENGTNLGLHNHFGSASENVFMLEKQQFAVLHDTWATKKIPDVDPESDVGGSNSKSLSGRAKIYYDAYARFDDADDFFDAIDDDLIDGSANRDGIGDDVSTLHMAFNREPGHGFGSSKHTSSAWSDQRVEDTHGGREDAYFGVPESEW